VIGESGASPRKLRNATVTTTGRAEVLRVARDDLDRLLTKYLHCVESWMRLSRGTCRAKPSARELAPSGTGSTAEFFGGVLSI